MCMECDVLKINREGRKTLKDVVTDEIILTIFLNEKELLTLLCSPGKLKELSVGFLYSSGLISSMNDIENVFVNTSNMTCHIKVKEHGIPADVIFKRIYTSGCGKGVLFHSMLDVVHEKTVTKKVQIPSEKIIHLMKDFEKKSTVYKETGGVHNAALSDDENILVFTEDIGRHNAIDKVIGEALYRNLNMEDLLVLTSGRISSEVMYKVQKMRSAFIISRSAPTSLAVKLADKWNVTLIAFARGHRMNVYTGKERIPEKM